jgi:hypothetical protein
VLPVPSPDVLDEGGQRQVIERDRQAEIGPRQVVPCALYDLYPRNDSRR